MLVRSQVKLSQVNLKNKKDVYSMANEMEQATKTAGKEMANMETNKDEAICSCPECGYSAPMTEFQEQESEAPEGEIGEPKAGMEVEIAVGKPKLMSAREAAMSAFKGK